MAKVEIANLSFKYRKDGTAVLHNISLDIEHGQFVVIVGPSGCGKSTLLRLVSGLEMPASGTIKFDGVDVTEVAPRQRDVAMVFQNYALYPQKTVAKNIAFPLVQQGVPRAECAVRVNQVAEMLELTQLLDRKPAQLSGGQRQRVAMGRAIVRRPALFLMDEPLSNLDAKLRVQTRSLIAQIQEQLNVSTVYVTHDQTEAMTLGDVVVVMNAGRIEQLGPPMELYSNPASLFVATFLGSPSMNIFDLELVRPYMREGFVAEVLAKKSVNVEDSRIKLAFRPESVRLVDLEQEATLRFAPTHSEILGSEAHIYGKLGQPSSTIVIKTAVESAMARPDTVFGRVAVEDVLLFDGETGMRLP